MKKFEKNIKDKLEKRRIEPSDRVWASIDKQLDRSKTRRFKKKYFMYGIAAGILIILGFLGLGLLKINSDPKLDAPKQAAPSSLDQPVDQTIREIQLSVNELAKRKRTKHFSFKIQYDQLEKYKSFDEFDEFDHQPKKELLMKMDSNQSSKGEKLLAEVENELKNDHLNEETQKLLDFANDKLTGSTEQQITSIKAEDLLQEVEFEIENETLKQKILLALEKKIDQAKNALTKL